MTRKIIILSLLGFVMFCFSANAQVSTSFFHSVNFSKIGVGYEFSNRFWADARIYGGFQPQDFTVEPTIFINFLHREEYDCYLGTGVSFAGIKNLVAPLGVRFRPVKNYSNFLIHFEATPTLSLEEKDEFIYASFGLRYIFPKKEQ